MKPNQTRAFIQIDEESLAHITGGMRPSLGPFFRCQPLNRGENEILKQGAAAGAAAARADAQARFFEWQKANPGAWPPSGDWRGNELRNRILTNPPGPHLRPGNR